jgi:manganese/iron transport system permease protein
VLDPFQLAFVQRGVLEVLLLSGAAGLLGTWIVMRGLSFYAHAVGTAAFPGLVLADGLGFSAPLGAFAAALLFAFGVERLARRPRAGYDSLTALVLVAALAGGVVLASDVFHSGGNVDSLLFGSLLLTGTRDLVLAGMASAAAIVATLVLGPRWLARGFDAASAQAMGLRSQLPDALLLVFIAFSVVASAFATPGEARTSKFVIGMPITLMMRWTTARASALPSVLVTLRVAAAPPVGASARPPRTCSRVGWLAAGAAKASTSAPVDASLRNVAMPTFPRAVNAIRMRRGVQHGM